MVGAFGLLALAAAAVTPPKSATREVGMPREIIFNHDGYGILGDLARTPMAEQDAADLLVMNGDADTVIDRDGSGAVWKHTVAHLRAADPSGRRLQTAWCPQGGHRPYHGNKRAIQFIHEQLGTPSLSAAQIAARPENAKARSAGAIRALADARGAAGSALRELEAAAGAGLAVLLAFLDARVAGQQAARLQDAAEFRLAADEGAGDAVAQGEGLSDLAAAADGGDDVELVGHAGDGQRLNDVVAHHIAHEVAVEGAAVDLDLAGAGPEADGGGGFLAPSGCAVFFYGRLGHRASSLLARLFSP
jgi:hypothetical protein